MTEAKHTPGPWCAGFDDDGGFVFDQDMQTIADTFSNSDARLIAAAPDMLEALKIYIGAFDRCGGSEAVSAAEFSEARSHMRAAIAKAEGRAP